MSSGPQHHKQGAHADLEPKIINAASFKGPKRKRLLKACDACHKSKRRCDGTAPCSNCYFAAKQCTYTDGSGRAVPAPNAPRPELVASSSSSILPSAGLNVFPQQLQSPDTTVSGPLTTVPLRYPNQIGTAGAHASTFHVQTTPGFSQHVATQDVDQRSHPRKRPRDHQDEEGAARDFKAELIFPPVAYASSSRNSRIPHHITQDAPQQRSHAGASGSVSSQHNTDRTVMRELANLFFAHCHPHRLIIHSPTFLNDLYFDRVPGYLLNAVCALAAPLSRNPHVRTSPVRQAGQQYARLALDELFDSHQRLKAPLHLHTAQSLALLQAHMVYESGRIEPDLPLFDLASQILESLNVHSPTPPAPGVVAPTSPSDIDPNRPILTPLPSSEMCMNAVYRECVRRTFWFIHLSDLFGFVFVGRRPTLSPRDLKRSVASPDAQRFPASQDQATAKGDKGMPSRHQDPLRIRLPCSEAEFEVSVYSALPEYLNGPAPKNRNASEFGHLIRITTVLVEIEQCNIEEPDAIAVSTCEERLKTWSAGLSENLQYSEENLEFQLSLWETSSNTTTWCFCFMHILYACCVLALNDIRRRLGHGQSHEYSGALDAVLKIMTGIGPRARNSIIMGIVLWLQHCGPHARHNSANGDPEGDTAHTQRRLSKRPNVPELQSNIEGWIKEWEEIWGPVQESHMQTTASALEKERLHRQQSGRLYRDTLVPDLVIDPTLMDENSENEQRMLGVVAAAAKSGGSQAPPPPPPQTSLPSLKSSGLLDVLPAPEEAGPSTGRVSPWSSSAASVSPRVPLRSPGLLPHPHLSSNPPSMSPGSPMSGAGSSSSRTLDPPSITSQDRSRDAMDLYVPSGPFQAYYPGETSGGNADRFPSSVSYHKARPPQHSTKLQPPTIVLPSHQDSTSQSPRQKHTSNLS